jgi:hypothetical protein
MGILLVAIAILQYFSTNKLLSIGVITHAEVISLESDGHILQHSSAPLLKFTIPNGKEYTLSPDVSSNIQLFNVGDRVKIIYNPNNPKKSRIVSYWGLYRWTVISLCFGLVFLTIGSGYFCYLVQIKS